MTKKQAKELSELLATIDIDILEEDLLELDSLDYLTEYLEENGFFNVEIIYYSNAIKYLAENDDSLLESTELAYNMGFDLKDLSSETLASILASEKTRQDYYDLESEIKDILD